MQHGGDQNRQLIPLRLALSRQPLCQLRPDPLRPNGDPVPLCHSAIPRQSERGIVITPGLNLSTHHDRKLMDGEDGTEFGLCRHRIRRCAAGI